MRLSILLISFLFLTGCAGLRGQVADIIGPEDAARVEVAVEALRERLREARDDAEARLRLRLEVAREEARLRLAERKAELLAEAERVKAEAQIALARAALERLQAELQP